MIALGCGLLLLGILAYVFYPERHVEAQRQKTRLEYLRERKDVLYDNLRDLNFEYRAGKYVEEDYRAQQTILEDEAAGVMAEIELLESQGTGSPGERAYPPQHVKSARAGGPGFGA